METYIVDNGNASYYFVRVESGVIESFFALFTRAWIDVDYAPFLVAKTTEVEWFHDHAIDFVTFLSYTTCYFYTPPSDRTAAKQVLEQCRQLGVKDYVLEPGIAEKYWNGIIDDG